MRAGADSCTCSKCGVHCTGRFPACSQVWQRSGVAVAVRAPEREADPEQDVLDDTLPDLSDASAPATYTPRRRASGAAWTRRRASSRVLPVAALVFLAMLLLFAAANSNDEESADRLSVTDRTEVSAPATTAAAAPPPAPTTVPEAPPTTAPPPPPTAAPPQPQPARAARAPTPAPAPARPPARQPARAAPAPTVGQFPRMCGFVPGGPVDVELNGRPAGEQRADRNGCVSRPPGR
jgi:hypothetical protein